MAAATATRGSSPGCCPGGHAFMRTAAGGHRVESPGVPSRMNLGQIMESELGWAGIQLDECTQPGVPVGHQRDDRGQAQAGRACRQLKVLLHDG